MEMPENDVGVGEGTLEDKFRFITRNTVFGGFAAKGTS